MLNIKKIVKKLTLYESDLYEGKIIIIPKKDSLVLKKSENEIIQTDATCWKRQGDNLFFINYNYVLVRKFDKQKIVNNEIYYDIDFLEDKGLETSELFPIYPNNEVLNHYLNYCDISLKTKEKCLEYAKRLNKLFHK